MEKYALYQLVTKAKEVDLVNKLKSLEGTDGDLEIDLGGFLFGAYGYGEGETRVALYPKLKYGCGLTARFDGITNEQSLMEEVYEANRVKLGDIEDLEVLDVIGEMMYVLMRLMREVSLDQPEMVTFLGGSKIKYFTSDDYIIYFDGITVELSLDNLMDCHKSTSVYRKVVANTTVWELIQLASYTKNQYESNK